FLAQRGRNHAVQSQLFWLPNWRTPIVARDRACFGEYRAAYAGLVLDALERARAAHGARRRPRPYSRSDAPSVWPRLASSHWPAASPIATTTRSPKPSTVSTCG